MVFPVGITKYRIASVYPAGVAMDEAAYEEFLRRLDERLTPDERANVVVKWDDAAARIDVRIMCGDDVLPSVVGELLDSMAA